MATIAIVYFSAGGHTHLVAEAVAKGVHEAGAEAKLLRITGDQISGGRWQNEEMMETLSQADAIIFGSPTYMGGVAAQFKAFIDAASSAWFARTWVNKIAAGFTHSGSLSGDKQGTLLYLAINAAQHGMVWVGSSEMPNSEGVNRLGSFLGVMAQTSPDTSGAAASIDAGDRLTAELLGQRVAKATNRWIRGQA